MAASSGAIRAGRAFVELFADDSKLARGLRQAQAKLSAWGASIRMAGYKLTALGGATAAPLIAAAMRVGRVGDELYDMARRTGLSVQALSMLSLAAERSGTDLETVERTIRIMQRTISGMKDDAEGTAAGLEHLGLAAADIKGLPVEQQFAAIGRAIAAMPNATERAAAAMKVFGRSGTMLLPMLEEFDQLSSEYKAAGMVKTPRQVAEAKSFAEATTIMGQTVKGVWSSIGEAMVPILKDKIELISRVALGIKEWAKQNGELIRTIFRVAVGTVIAGGALVALGTAISFAAKAFGILHSIVGVIPKALHLVGAAMAFVLSPAGLAAGVWIGLGAAFVNSIGGMGAATEWLSDRFKGLADFAAASFQGIADAMAKGRFDLAAAVMWAGLKAAWIEGTTALRLVWETFRGWFGKKLTEAWGGWKLVFIEASTLPSETKHQLRQQVLMETQSSLDLIDADVNLKKQMAQSALADARRAWEAARAAVAAAPGLPEPPKAPGVDELLKRLQSAATALPQAVERSMVSGPRGIFSPEALLSLKAGGAMAPMARIAAATADTAALVKQVVENTAQLVMHARDSDVFAPP